MLSNNKAAITMLNSAPVSVSKVQGALILPTHQSAVDTNKLREIKRGSLLFRLNREETRPMNIVVLSVHGVP